MTIYLIRHAQSAFNAVYDPNKPDPMIFDAPITALGETQAQQARSEVQQLDLINVIVSPFTRALQTAQLIFGNRLPFQINSEVREQLCNSCDVGSPPHELARDYPHLDFDHQMIAGGMMEKRTTVGSQLSLKRFCWQGRTGSSTCRMVGLGNRGSGMIAQVSH